VAAERAAARARARWRGGGSGIGGGGEGGDSAAGGGLPLLLLVLHHQVRPDARSAAQKGEWRGVLEDSTSEASRCAGEAVANRWRRVESSRAVNATHQQMAAYAERGRSKRGASTTTAILRLRSEQGERDRPQGAPPPKRWSGSTKYLRGGPMKDRAFGPTKRATRGLRIANNQPSD
jgi:hypothetical protein